MIPTELVRLALVDAAAAVASASRRGGAPAITADSSAEDIAEWLQWCDPGGCHTAELGAAERLDPYTLEAAWDALALMLADDEVGT